MRTIILIDGQNLYHLARGAWASGSSPPYAWPSYDVEKLASLQVSRIPGRTLAETRFYTGVPDPAAGPSQLFWHGFWSNKIRYLRSWGIYVYQGRVNAGGQEKGVDVSLALDLVRATTELEESGKFIRRTGDILLCRVDDSYAYFIKVLPYGRNVSAPWYRKELIEIIHENWPESIRHALAIDVTGTSPKLNDQEVAELRKSGNIALLLEMSDGTVYVPPGVGNTLGLVATDGSSVNDTKPKPRWDVHSHRLESGESQMRRGDQKRG